MYEPNSYWTAAISSAHAVLETEKYWQVADKFWLSLFYLSMAAQQTSLKLWLQCVLLSFPSVTETKEQLCWWHFQFSISEVSVRMSAVAKITENRLPTRRSASKVAHRFHWQGKTGDWLGRTALCPASHRNRLLLEPKSQQREKGTQCLFMVYSQKPHGISTAPHWLAIHMTPLRMSVFILYFSALK